MIRRSMVVCVGFMQRNAHLLLQCSLCILVGMALSLAVNDLLGVHSNWTVMMVMITVLLVIALWLNWLNWRNKI